jgi:hypothetical protein
MNSEKTQHHKAKKHFAGCVELIPPQPLCIEFIDTHRSWGFPITHLAELVLEENPDHRDRKTLPPEQIVLRYRRSKVVLKGWRLELLAGPLIAGRVARIHAEKHLGALMLEEAWVSEIHVAPLDGKQDAASAIKK